MGQKVHPLGFRLNTTQKHKSIWYTSLNNYATLLEQDDQIRTFILNSVNSASIVEIEIKRISDLNNIFLKIYTVKTESLIGKLGLIALKLNQSLTKRLRLENKIVIDIREITNPDSHAILLAHFISDHLIRRVAFKRVVQEAVKRAYAQRVRGVKIQVSGRLNGAEIARTEWVKKGQMPLQTLRAKIDYATVTAETVYGSMGIKVWLFKGVDCY